MIITVSGLPGSGTTTISNLLAIHYSMKVISAGEIFRILAKEKDMSLDELSLLAEQDPSIDIQIDEKQKKIAINEDNVILEGRLAGYMANNALKIWLKSSLEERVKRIVSRENIIFEQAYKETISRESSEASRYLDIHNIDIKNLDVYDVIIDSGKWNQYQICDIICTCVDYYVDRNIKP